VGELTSYSCDDFCKRESFASLWKPPAKKHRHRVRAEVRAVPKLLLVVLLRGEKLGRVADELDKRRKMRAHSHRPAQLPRIQAHSHVWRTSKVAVQRTATFFQVFVARSNARPVNSLGSVARYQAHRGPRRATLLWCRRLELDHHRLGQRVSTRKGRNFARIFHE
jgi:hypothetical protein